MFLGVQRHYQQHECTTVYFRVLNTLKPSQTRDFQPFVSVNHQRLAPTRHKTKLSFCPALNNALCVTFVSLQHFTHNSLTTCRRCPGAVLRWGIGAHAPQINLLPPHSKASWKVYAKYGVRICFGFGERIKSLKWTRL